MGRAKTKEELIISSNENYTKLMKIIDDLPEEIINTTFDFSKNNKKEAHCDRDKNLRDVLIHLYEWHNLMLKWIDNNKNGNEKAFLPKPYNWKTYGEMNISFFEKHQSTALEASRKMFETSHWEVMKSIDEFTNEELFTKGTYKWVGGSTLGAYFVSCTSSHYEWAIKKIKLHLKNCNQKV